MAFHYDAKSNTMVDDNAPVYNSSGQIISPTTKNTPAPNSQPSYSGKSPIPDNIYASLTNMVKSGQMTTQQAIQSIQGLISGGQYSDTGINTAKLFPAGQQFTAQNGQALQFDNSGTGATVPLKKVGQAQVVDTSALSTDQKGALSQLDNYLQQLQKAGTFINPNAQINAKTMTDFLSQAKDIVHPYYATQLNAAISDLNNKFNYETTTLNNNEQRAEDKYGRDLGTLAGNEADRGFALSGIRNKDENVLATDTQNSLDDARRQLGYNAGNEAGAFAQKYGGDNALNLPSPYLQGSAHVVAGQSGFSRPGGNSALYTLSPSLYQGLIGSEQNAESTATKAIASGLATNANSRSSADLLANLTK